MSTTTVASVGVSGFLQKFKMPLVGAACAAVGFLAGRATAPKPPSARTPARRQLAGVPRRKSKKKSPTRSGAKKKSGARMYQLKP